MSHQEGDCYNVIEVETALREKMLAGDVYERAVPSNRSYIKRGPLAVPTKSTWKTTVLMQEKKCETAVGHKS